MKENYILWASGTVAIAGTIFIVATPIARYLDSIRHHLHCISSSLQNDTLVKKLAEQSANQTSGIMNICDRLGELKTTINTVGGRIEQQYANMNEMVTDKDPKMIFKYALECLCNNQRQEQARKLYESWQSTFPEDLLD